MKGRFIIIFAAAISLASCGPFDEKTSDACKPSEAQNIAQYQAMKAQADNQVAATKRVTELQLAVLKACVDKGYIPSFINQNVDCQAQGK